MSPHDGSDLRPAAPSLPWRVGSAATMGCIAAASRAFLLGASRLQTHGLDEFLRVLDARREPAERARGLITVSNHTSVLDDPLMWGALPLRYSSNPDNMRWALGSHDLVFKYRPLALFFALGQVLPTHRIQYSKFGGLFQPTVTQAIRLLSAQDGPAPAAISEDDQERTHILDPFSSAQLTYSTNGSDSFPVPGAYRSRRGAWVHVYPEGRIHQRADRVMRYFRWGVARLILESEPCPDMVPIYIEGFDEVMHEAREFPRFVPRVGKELHVTFGSRVDMEARFGDLRERWRKLEGMNLEAGKERRELGTLSEDLKYGETAVELRKECTLRVREEVLKVRRLRGYPDEDPKERLVDTWRAEGSLKQDGKMGDGSWVRDI